MPNPKKVAAGKVHKEKMLARDPQYFQKIGSSGGQETAKSWKTFKKLQRLAEK